MTDTEVIISLLSVITLIEGIRLVFALASRIKAWLQERKTKR